MTYRAAASFHKTGQEKVSNEPHNLNRQSLENRHQRHLEAGGHTPAMQKQITRDKVFDPFPFGLLTMIVSLEAIFLACFVLISQNRQAQKDKVRADIEYEVNIKAELEVARLHEKTDRIYEQMMARFEKLEKRMTSS